MEDRRGGGGGEEEIGQGHTNGGGRGSRKPGCRALKGNATRVSTGEKRTDKREDS